MSRPTTGNVNCCPCEVTKSLVGLLINILFCNKIIQHSFLWIFYAKWRNNKLEKFCRDESILEIIHDHALIWFDMEILTSNAYEHLRLYCIINIVNLVYVNVSANLVVIFRKVSYKGYITKPSTVSLILYICVSVLGTFGNMFINHLTPNDHFTGRTAALTFRCCILYIYSTNIRTEYFKHAA